MRISLKILRSFFIIFSVLCLYIGFKQVSLKEKFRKFSENQADRKERLRMECQKLESKHRNVSKITKNLIVIRRNSLLYCGIAKVGCTFLKRLALTLSSKAGQYSSPFDIAPNKVHFQYVETISNIPDPMKVIMLKNFTKFLFVRDPYARLFSGYVDKFFTPQTAFQHDYGRYIIRKFRKSPSSKSLNCGHDVTFREFVQFVIASIKGDGRPNPHFMPMYLQCDPCAQPYDMIGRLESLRDDLSLILPSQKSRDYLPENLKELSQLDEVRDAVSIAFSNRSGRKGCLTFHELLQRIWRRLQIRGLISRHIGYPLSKNYSEMLSRETFQQILNMALIRSWRDKSTKENRKNAMIEAFKTLPKEELDQLSNVLQIDCRLFGYDSKPDLIFNSKSHKSSNFQFFNFNQT